MRIACGTQIGRCAALMLLLMGTIRSSRPGQPRSARFGGSDRGNSRYPALAALDGERAFLAWQQDGEIQATVPAEP